MNRLLTSCRRLAATAILLLCVAALALSQTLIPTPRMHALLSPGDLTERAFAMNDGAQVSHSQAPEPNRQCMNIKLAPIEITDGDLAPAGGFCKPAFVPVVNVPAGAGPQVPTPPPRSA